MKLTGHTHRSRRGFTLVEVLCYLAVIGLVASLAMATLFQLIKQSAALQRNCEEIAAAVKAGETWRDDIRQATPELDGDQSTDRLILNSGERTITYTLKDGTVWRKTGANSPEVAFLRGVKASRFAAVPRKSVTAWLWEIELQTSTKSGPVRPLFSFTAVPAHQVTR